MMHPRKVLWVSLLLLLVASGVVFAAAGKEEQPAAAAGKFPVPRHEAVVVETDMTYQYFNTANPLKPTGGTQWGSGWHQVVNEWDWYANYATGERILWRTTGWEYGPDYKSLTWHVRKGVTWNDGQPYTARDIEFTFNLWMKDTSLSGASTANNVASVKATDDYTVVFTFKQADYRWHHNLRMWGGGSIVAKHIYEKVDAKTYNNWPPVETGPYKLQGWYQDNGLFVWERDPNYWGTKVMGKTPGPKYVIYRSAPPPDLDLEEFVQGNVDMPLPHIFTIDMIRASQKRWDKTVVSPYTDAVSTGISGFQIGRPPMNNREFRWALQYLLNREKLMRIYPMAESTTVTMWPWPDWKTLTKWESKTIADKYGPMLKYDPAKAASELDRLGFKKGADGKRTLPDGKPFTLTLVSGKAPDFNYLVAEDFAAELTKIGIDNVLKISGAGITDQQFSQGEFDIHFDVLEIHTSFPGDPWQFIDSYSMKHNTPIGQLMTSGSRSRVRMDDPEIDKLADQLRVTDPDSAAYLPLVEKALDRWYYNLPAVPAVQKTFVQTLSGKYWSNWPVPGNMYQVPYQWWPSMIFIMFELKPTGAM
jgi:peptide/nickel transport system substrate-binding protein